ncbi:RTA1-domain-containing protein [Stipitochalara longipes BDJ]|nr:RTA1-domain-containing protein [Stipitochalara longipes BDJ]
MAVLEPYAGTAFYLWKYIPSIAASIAFAILYLITGSLIGFRMYKTKTWFCAAFVTGCFMEIIGYIGRALAANQTGSLGPFVIQATFILLPPAFFAASIYMILARIIRAVDGDHLSIIKPRIVTRIFVTGDFLSIGVQGTTAGMTQHDNLRTLATVLVLIGLAIQLVSFALFGFCAIIFHKRIRRSPTTRSQQAGSKWLHTLYMLYAVSLLIIIRSVFRVVEYAFGQNGYPMAHEWTLFAFDSVPMTLVTIIFFFFYPSDLAPKLDDDAAIQLASCGSVRESKQSVNENAV